MAIDIFARLGDIKGESRDDRHRDEIDVQSFSWGVAQSVSGGAGGGAGAGKPAFQALALVHAVDRASPLLMRACATGERLRDAVIAQRRGGGREQDYLIIQLEDVTITSVASTASADGNLETVTLAFGKVQFDYRPQKPDGSPDAPVQFTFDLKANR